MRKVCVRCDKFCLLFHFVRVIFCKKFVQAKNHHKFYHTFLSGISFRAFKREADDETKKTHSLSNYSSAAVNADLNSRLVLSTHLSQERAYHEKSFHQFARES